MSGSVQVILVTGANTGLGLDICRRTIDEFFAQRPDDAELHLIYTTRDSRKGSATTKLLQKHASRSPSLKAQTSNRLNFSSYNVDLTKLKEVLSLANQLKQDLDHINSVIFNAGISGATGLDYFRAIPAVLFDTLEAVTWPTYITAAKNLLAQPQLPTEESEPPLGQIFCANVFGHHMLAHALSTLLGASTPDKARIIWVSSLEVSAADLHMNDIQALQSPRAYQVSKRVTDIMALSSRLPKCHKLVQKYLQTDNAQLYLCHPGIVSTSIVPLPAILQFLKKMSFYVARLLGSPWHVIHTYSAAVAPVWLALSPSSTLDGYETQYGVSKWGSACDVNGDERVDRTEVEGWGYGGRVGEPIVSTGRKRGAVPVTQEQLREFEGLGVQVWQQLEALREEWMRILQKET